MILDNSWGRLRVPRSGILSFEGEPMIQQIGRYRIRHKLGEGGMGVVYAAHDPRLERSVAIKTVRGEGVDDSARQRLWREARAAARVSHPNVCQLHEIDEENGVLFLVMELLEGETLADRIARDTTAARRVRCRSRSPS